jgi:tetratricopeptide (TPR) repeat protein
MIAPRFIFVLLFSVIAGCGSPEKTTTSTGSVPAVESGESLYSMGHSWFVNGNYDSAIVYLERSRSIDRTFSPALRDLAEIYYAGGITGVQSERERNMRAALECYATLDSLHQADDAMYDRMTELAHGLGEKDRFLKYAEKQVKRFPGDRQLYNLGLAYLGVGEFQKVIETQKGAIEKYPHSPFIAGFYRLLGDGYLGVDRQQSAERTYEQGVTVAVDRALEMKEADPRVAETPEYRQLADNHKAMVASLKKIYRLHGKQEKLKELESRPDVNP